MIKRSPRVRNLVPRRARRLVLLLSGGALLIAALAALANSSRTSAPVPDTSQTGAIAPRSSVPQTTAKVVFVRGRRFAPRTRAVQPGEPGRATAIRALLAGPTTAERRSGIGTTLARETRLISVSVENGRATVALTRPRTKPTPVEVSLRPARAAQIVYTLIASPDIERVRIVLNGRETATFAASKLTIKDARGGLTRPVRLPARPALVPNGPAPTDPRGVQTRLATLRYLPARAVTGRWDDRTFHAVTAFQAWQRLSRDGIVGAQTLAALETAAPPEPARSTSGRHVEVYRTRGVTLLVDHGRLVRALHSSSGTKGYETPAGSYAIFRKERNSWSVPYKQWLPHASYFNRGIAFHGYPSVPAWPASHGCVRLPTAEAPFAYDFLTIGTSVSVY